MKSAFGLALVLALTLALAAAFAPVRAADPVPPVIANLVAAQRPNTFLVDITYDLIDPDSQTVYVLVECSADGGQTYGVPITALTGDAGPVKPGAGKKLVWNAWNDWAGHHTTNAHIRIVADDTASLLPQPPTSPPATNLVWIPPGAFNMSGAYVWLTKGFWMGRFEVTQAEFQDVMSSNPSSWKSPNRPVESVTWFEAVKYCETLTARERAAGRIDSNWSYRLPTEAEWEYACRAGTTTTYGFGDDAARVTFYAWYNANSGGQTHEVGSRGPNRWGLYDMHGNVWEWCSDWYAGLPGGNLTDPQGPPSGSSRVIRGGSWDSSADSCRSAYRISYSPTSGRSNLGFRVVLAPGQ